MSLWIEYQEKYKEGRKDGLEEGIEKGHNEMLSIIRYLNQGHSPEETSQKFDLPLNEINNIIRKISN